MNFKPCQRFVLSVGSKTNNKMEESEKKLFLETYKNINTYKVLETFTPPNRNKNWAKKGDT